MKLNFYQINQNMILISEVKFSSNKSKYDFMSVLFPIIFNCSSLFFSLFTNPYFLSSSFNPFLKNLLNRE